MLGTEQVHFLGEAAGGGGPSKPIDAHVQLTLLESHQASGEPWEGATLSRTLWDLRAMEQQPTDQGQARTLQKEAVRCSPTYRSGEPSPLHLMPHKGGVATSITWNSAGEVSSPPHLLIESIISRVSVDSCIFILCFEV